MSRRSAGLVLLVLLTSCGGSGNGPNSIVAPPPDIVAIVVSPNAADHPDYLVDGVDDDVEINLAIRSADSVSNWTVLLRPGTYHVRSGINVTSNVTLRGSGANTVIRLDDFAPSMIATAGIIRAKDDARRGPDKRVRNVTLEDFVVDGNRAHQAPGNDEKKFGFYGEGDSITFRRLVAKNCAGYGFDPHAFSDSIPSTNILIEDCEAFGNQLDGFALDLLVNSTFRRNYSHNNDRHGVNVVTGTHDMLVTDSRAVGNGGSGVMAQNGTHDVIIQSCEVASNTLQGMFLRDADGCTLAGNTFRGNERSGLLLRLSDHVTITGNTFNENSTGAAGRAVVQLDSATVNMVGSNIITSSKAKWGVLESGTSDYNQVRNNVIAITVASNHVVLIGPNSTQSGNQLHVP